MGLFLVGILTGFFLGVLFRDILRHTTHWMTLGIAARQKKQELDSIIQKLQDHANDSN